jgi:uncharacterized protein YcaQ
MKPVSVSLAEVRTLILNRFFEKISARHPSDPVAEALDRWGYIQIDTISRITRAHHHALYNRIEGYSPVQLDDSVEQREVFEYWSHAAAYLPMNRFRYCLPRMERMRREAFFGMKLDAKLLKDVHDRIRDEGPLMSRDFKRPADSGGGQWWDWKPAKMALEILFQQGRLLVAGRRNFQKLYALPEDVLPEGIDTSLPDEREMASHIIDLSMKSQGISRWPHIKSQHKDGVSYIPRRIEEELEDGSLISLDVDDSGIWYCRPSFLEGKPGESESLRIVSPFDSLVINRPWLAELFGVNYQIECYVPAPKRRYGYFTLPIFTREGFAGLLDAKAERVEGRFRIISLHLVPGAWNVPAFDDALESELQRFADFHKCPEIVWDEGSRKLYDAPAPSSR